MKNERHRISTAATLPCGRWIPFGLALAVLTVTACTPPATDEPDVTQPTAVATEETLEVAVVQSSNIQPYLQRLAEPSLSENCSGEFTSYRLLKLDADQHVAAVRISWNADEGAYRSVTSLSSDRAISSEGYVNERTWNRIEAEMGYADFWSLESERNASGFDEPSFFLEGCKNGEYHWLQRNQSDTWLARIVRIFTSVGKLEWLDTGQ